MTRFEDGSYGSVPGTALIGKVLAGRCRMEYTRVAVGKGNIPEGMTPKTMTEPAGYVMDAKIAAITNPVDGECQVTVQINSADVEHGFYCTGILLYANDPDSGEVPYTYLVLENEPEWIRPSSSIVGKLATFDLIAAVGDVDAVYATIDPEAVATVARVAQMIEDHNNDPNAHAGISGGGYYGTIAVTIPATGWRRAENPSADHDFVCDVEADVRGDMVPVGGPTVGNFRIANSFGLVNGCETFDGYIRFYAKGAPSKDIQGSITLYTKGGGSGGGGSGGSVTPGMGLGYGTDGKLNVLIGEGLSYDKNNALAVNPTAVVTSDDLVDETDVMDSVKEMLQED